MITTKNSTVDCMRVCAQLEMLNMDPVFLNRNVNEGFSGGERKRNEILQMAVLEVGLAALCGGACSTTVGGGGVQHHRGGGRAAPLLPALLPAPLPCPLPCLLPLTALPCLSCSRLPCWPPAPPAPPWPLLPPCSSLAPALPWHLLPPGPPVPRPAPHPAPCCPTPRVPATAPEPCPRPCSLPPPPPPPTWCQADLAILDEIDSGLDIDALRDVAKAVNGLKRADTGIIMITHYKVERNGYRHPESIHNKLIVIIVIVFLEMNSNNIVILG